MKTINLTMIVKDEAAIIGRCLDSVKGVIDHWTICDTGSTDATKDIIRKTLAGIPGELHETEWKNFAHNRSEALRLSRGKADYHLLLDADSSLVVKQEFRDELKLDSYLIGQEGPFDYYHEWLVSDRHEWYYVGAIHEYIQTDFPRVRGILPQLSLQEFNDGSRSKRGNKFLQDSEILLSEHEKDPSNSRTVFYLAQSYRDGGKIAHALDSYKKRSEMGGWDEEVWYSLYQIPQLEHKLGAKWSTVMESYLRAYQFRPSRLEPLFHIAKYYREQRQFELGWVFTKATLNFPYPTTDILFIEKNIYEWEMPTEYAVCAYYVGEYEEANRMNERIINCAGAPEYFRELARSNAKFTGKRVVSTT